jgi:inosine/xanthosine triphosphate pyrophosphatase family protein
MKILIATHNPAKFNRYRKLITFCDTSVEAVSLSELEITRKVSENFQTAKENAIFKAEEYAKLSGMITMAVDEATLTNFLPDNEQPGVYARRFSKHKKELTDNELLETWLEIFKKYPQEDKVFVWDFAIAVCDPQKGLLGVSNVEQLSHVGNYVSEKREKGYPLSSILSPKKGGKTYVDLSDEEKFQVDKEYFATFFTDFNKWILAHKK